MRDLFEPKSMQDDVRYDPCGPEIEPPNREYLRDEGLNLEVAFMALQMEDAAQIDKWGIQEHHIFEWLAYVTEELGELAKSISEYVYRGGKKEDIIEEAIQVSTLAIKIATMVDEQLEAKARKS